MRICSSCGAENVESNRYCGACGTALERDEALRREIDAAVERALARMKDRDVVETQLANAEQGGVNAPAVRDIFKRRGATLTP